MFLSTSSISSKLEIDIYNNDSKIDSDLPALTASLHLFYNLQYQFLLPTPKVISWNLYFLIRKSEIISNVLTNCNPTFCKLFCATVLPFLPLHMGSLYGILCFTCRKLLAIMLIQRDLMFYQTFMKLD